MQKRREMGGESRMRETKRQERKGAKRKGDMQRGIERIEDKREWRGRE